MSTETYYLIAPDGEVAAKFEIYKRGTHSIMGYCYSVVSWNLDGTPYEFEFIADVYLKWDACTHWNFYGEDYDPEIDKEQREQDSYYHLCGAHTFMRHIQCMCFVWKLAEILLTETGAPGCQFTNDWYYDSERMKQLIELTIGDHTIKKVEEQNEKL